jgi:hypothetical protein
MRALTVEARNLESARGLCDALSGFEPEMTGSEGDGYRVAVELGSFDSSCRDCFAANGNRCARARGS